MDISEAEEILRGVTPGPWTLCRLADQTPYSIQASYGCVNGLSALFTLAHINVPDEAEVGMTDGAFDPETADANARFIAWCREGVPALLARIAAQEVQIKGLEVERDEAVSKAKKNAKVAAKAYTIITLASDDLQDEGDRVYLGSTNTADILRDAREEWAAHRIIGDSALTLVEENWVLKARADATETALAAEKAKVAKLVEAWDLARSHSLVKVTLGDGDARKSWGDFLIAMDEARAAITEAGQ